MSSNIDPADNPIHGVATEFVTEEFETEVTTGATEQLATTIEEIVADLRLQLVSDDRLEELLRSQPGPVVLRENDSQERMDPEPLTQRTIIEPLLNALGYEDLAVEAGDLSDTRGRQADYSISLREYDDIESNRLLIEAEPLNKKLDQDAHGLGQVKDWLERDKFEADFGIATDGVRWVLIKYDRDTYTFDTIADINLQPVFLAAFENLTGRQVSLDEWLDDDATDLVSDFIRTVEFDNFRSIAGEARTVIRERKEAITDEFYDEYVRLVFGVAPDEDERRVRSLSGEGVIAPEGATGDDVRLFAVELMNRLIFIKFLEDKGLVEPDLLQQLREDHEARLSGGTFYKDYLERLFFGVLDERPSSRPTRLQQLDIYADVPYLNGGLFRPTVYEDPAVDDTDFDVRDNVLGSIIDLLERYSFSADGGPTDLDPSILGNVFEKTINHITTDSGDKQKELGAYYTPDEITSFCAEETVRPGLLERFQETMVANWGWTEETAEAYDNVFDLVDALPPNTDIVEDLLDDVDHFRALDPACGSGHFLTSVESEIVAIRKALYGHHDDDPETWELRKQTVVENIYGVDIVAPAVEIAKLRLWLSIIAEVDPETAERYDEDDLALPNVVFNVRQGNSLIGYTDLMETKGDGEQAQLSSWGSDSVRQKYGNIITQIQRHKRAETTEEAMEYLREAERLLDEYRNDLDHKVLNEFHEAGIEDATLEQVRSYDPFHWVLEFAEVYADGGFDVIVGNPPWEVLRIDREDFFVRYDQRFRTRMPSKKESIINDLLSDEEVAAAWEKYKHDMQLRADYFNNSGDYQLQSPRIDGRKVTTENELSALFLERVFNIADDGGRVSFILPNVIFVGSSGKDLRKHLLDTTTISSIVHFENRGIFEELDSRYRFGVLTFKNTGVTHDITAIFSETSLEVFNEFSNRTVGINREMVEEYSPKALSFPQVSIRWDQHEGEVDPRRAVQILEKILQHPSLDDQIEDHWYAEPHRELDRSYDSDRFIENPEEADYPVYGGKNVYQYIYDDAFLDVQPPELWSVDEDRNPDLSAKRRIREKEVRNLKTALYEAFDGSGSQKQFVNSLLEEHRGESLSESDVLLDCTNPRIVFRDITHSTNERTFVAGVIPRDVVCHSKLRTIRPYVIEPEEVHLSHSPLHDVYQSAFSDRELFAALGLFNSLPYDHLMRIKIYTTIVEYKFKESRVPRLISDDDWFEYISSRAARLNCYGDEFAEMRERLGGIKPAPDMDERTRLQAEIDAAAFHAYGLNREETGFVLNDFHRVRDPRLMTEDYFDLVLETYDDLADEGPMP